MNSFDVFVIKGFTVASELLSRGLEKKSKVRVHWILRLSDQVKGYPIKVF